MNYKTGQQMDKSHDKRGSKEHDSKCSQEKSHYLRMISFLQQQIIRCKALNSQLLRRGKHKRTSSDEQTFIFNQTNISSFYPVMPQKTCTWLHRATFKSHLDSVRALLWHGQVLISASDDCTVKLWDCALLLSTVREHLGPVYCVTSVGSEVFTAGAEGVVRQWSIDELLKNNRASHELDLHGDSIWGMISKEGLLVTSSSDRSHKIVCTRNGLQEQVCLQVSNEDTPTAMDWLGDNKFVSGYVRSQRIIVYDLETAKYSGEYSFESKKELSQTNYLLHSPLHQLLATAQEDNLIRLFDTKANKRVKEFVAHSDAVTSLLFRPDSFELISCGHDGNLRVWDLRKYKCLADVAVHMRKYDQSALCLARSEEQGSVAIGGADGLIKLVHPEQ